MKMKKIAKQKNLSHYMVNITCKILYNGFIKFNR